MTDSIQSRFLTAEEAAACANISEETIFKYKELGLLRAFRVNGQEQYREDEIRMIFNARMKAAQHSVEHVASKTPEATVSLKETIQKSDEANKNSEEELPTLHDILREDTPLAASIEKSSTDTQNQGTHTQAEFVKNRENAPDFRSFDIPSIELLELTRSLKDQLETVKEERNWLRRRVEKLEASIEREQMIAISKTESLRNLIEQRSTTKSSWSFLLPWNK